MNLEKRSSFVRYNVVICFSLALLNISNVSEAKCQVLANLANFAYDPINYEFLRKLRVLDLFLEQLSQNNEQLLNFGLAGLCNLSAGKS